jgi:hypothetical protein
MSKYDPDKLVNIGTNHFTFKPELGISKKSDPLFLELTGGVAFCTTNHDFYQGKRLSQDPIGSIQGHVICRFRRSIWAALDGTCYRGGSTKFDGVKGDNLQKNSRFGFTFALPLGINHSLKLNLSTGVSARTGSNLTLLGVEWRYWWGSDLSKK